MNSCSRLIISEPVNTLTNRGGLIGKIAGQSANAGSGPEDFRFDKEKLINLLNELCHDRWILNEINGKNKNVELQLVKENLKVKVSLNDFFYLLNGVEMVMKERFGYNHNKKD